MTVIILSAVPPGLRGHLTRWLLEISPGVFVGYISSRVRELLWYRVIEHIDQGRALMVHGTRNEQRLVFKVHCHDWEPVDYEGISLMRRHTVPDYVPVERRSSPPTTPSAGQVADATGPETMWKRREARKKI